MTFSALWLKLVALFPEKGMAVCVAVIGKENSPLYIRWYCFDIDLLLVMEKPPLRSWISFANLVLSSCADPAQELTFHYSLHTSLDVIEEKLSASNKAAGSDQRELYLGALNSSEHQKVFGYVTNTRIKFVIIVDSSNTSLRDNETRQMFRLIPKSRKSILIKILQEAPPGLHQRSGQPILCARPADYLKVSLFKMASCNMIGIYSCPTKL